MNWELAAFEIDEIKEGLEDAEGLIPALDGIPIAEMIKTNIDPALAGVKKAAEARSSVQFASAFDNLTKACNACHAAAKRPFIRIQRPTPVPLTNQNFAPTER